MKKDNKEMYRFFAMLFLVVGMIVLALALTGEEKVNQPVIINGSNYFYNEYTKGNCNVFMVRGSYDVQNKTYTDWFGNKTSTLVVPRNSFICYNYI